MTNPVRCLLWALLMVLCSVPGWGAVYYVDSSIADRNVASGAPDFSTYNPATFATDTGSASVYKTLDDLAAKTFLAGDQVYFRRGGNWSGKLSFSTSVTYGAFGAGPRPRIVGSGFDYAGYANSAANFTVQDIEFANERFTAVYVFNSFAEGNNNTFRRCRFTVTGPVTYASGKNALYINPGDRPMSGYVIDNNEISGGDSGLLLATWGGSPSLFDFTISNNYIHDVAGAGIKIFAVRQDATSTSSPYGIDIDGNTISRTGYQAIWIMGGLREVPGHPSYIRNNTATEIGTMSSPNVNAFQLNWLRGTIIEYNVIRNVYTSAPDGNGIFPDIAWGSQSYRSHGVIVRHNQVSGCRASAGRTAGISAGSSSDSEFYHNSLFDNEIGMEFVTEKATGNLFHHNVFDRNAYGVMVPQPMFGLGYAPSSVWEYNLFSNNSLYGFYYAAGNTPPTESNNVFFGNGLADIWGAGMVQPLDPSDSRNDPAAESATGPALVLSTLADHALTNKPTLNVSGKVTAAEGVRGVTVNGVPLPLGADGSFSSAVTLAEGVNLVAVVATDQAGRERSETRSITLDRTVPALEVAAPADGSYVNRSLLTITGTINPADQVAVSAAVGEVSPRAATLEGSDYAVTVQLAPGSNTVSIAATDLAGKKTTVKRTVTLNTERPALTISHPVQDLTIRQAEYLLRGRVSGAVPAAVTVSAEGRAYTPTLEADGSFQQQLSFSGLNSHAVVVTAVDLAGSSSTVQRNFIYTDAQGGDVNGDGAVDLIDAALALRCAVADLAPTEAQLRRGDVAPIVSGMPIPNGAIDAADVLVILRKIVGLQNW